MGDAALDVFDGETAVGDGTIPREALRTQPIERVSEDKIARRRGLTPIAEPYVREREVVRVARGWFYFGLALSTASLVAMAGVVMWSRQEVRRQRDDVAIAEARARAAEARLAMPPPPAPVDAPAVVAPPECVPPMTELTLDSRPPGAKVTLDGRELGTTPLVTSVMRYQPGFFEFRVPGRATARRKIVPTEPTEELRVTLHRRD